MPHPYHTGQGWGEYGISRGFDARFQPGGWGVQLTASAGVRACALYNTCSLLEFKMADVAVDKTVIVILDKKDKRKRNRRVSLSGGKKELVEATRRVFSDILAPEDDVFFQVVLYLIDGTE